MIVTERERGRDTGRGRSRLHAPGTRRGIRSRVSRIAPWAKGRRQTAAPPRDPLFIVLNKRESFVEGRVVHYQMPLRNQRKQRMRKGLGFMI